MSDPIVGVSDSGSDYYDVHLGFWTNWSYGKVYGATFTTTRKNGGLLIAFLALFVGWAGKSFWRIICLILHRSLSRSEIQDTIYHQRQAVIRNAETPQTALWQLGRLSIAWRHKSRLLLLRVTGIATIALLSWAAFAVSSILSSRVATGSANEIVLTGRDCRLTHLFNDDESSFALWDSQRSAAYLDYAQKCYTDPRNADNCRQYVKPKLDLKISRNADCPFAKHMCLTEAMSIDTGYLHSNRDFGLNLAPGFEIEFRQMETCAPITTTGYVTVQNRTSDRGSNYTTTVYHYGNFSGNGHIPAIDYIYQVIEKPLFGEWMVPNFNPSLQYELGVVGFGKSETSLRSLRSIPELERADAFVALIFLSAQSLVYSEPVDDPWFSAHVHVEHHIKNLTVIEFERDEPATVLGCTQQFQVCKPTRNGNRKCTELGDTRIFKTASALWEQETEKNRDLLMAFNTTLLGGGWISFGDVVWLSRSRALLADFQVSYAHSGPLPNDQWQREMLRWSSASATSLQAMFVERATGANHLNNSMSIPPSTPGEIQLCQSQRIMSTRYYSFSVLGISIILGIGGLFLLIDASLEAVLDCIQRKQHKYDYSRLEWKTNALLQIHRLAHEGIGSGKWIKAVDAVPITAAGELLASLDIENLEHPKLKSVLDGIIPPTNMPSDTETNEDDSGVRLIQLGSIEAQERTSLRETTSAGDFIGSEEPSGQDLPTVQTESVVQEEPTTEQEVTEQEESTTEEANAQENRMVQGSPTLQRETMI